MRRFLTRRHLVIGASIALLLFMPLGTWLTALLPLGHLSTPPTGDGEWEVALLREEVSRLSSLPPPLFDAISARIIHREPALWSSFVWVNKGARDGVQEESPVVVGRSLVGIVESVLEKKSQIRLITDRALIPSVRVVRGEPQRAFLISNLLPLMAAFPEDSHLEALHTRLLESGGAVYAAKGEVVGSSAPLWRSARAQLEAVGFQYDVADAYGPARECGSGRPYAGGEALELFKEGDLLVTTGMDGLFPAGLDVAYVTSVTAPLEGEVSYKGVATPTAGSLDSLTHVTLLPPVEGS